jgi:tetratricopeptide (TPR) repeat protein
MSNELALLQSGLEALKHRNYSEAINLLENFCQRCEVNAQTMLKAYSQAQMGLIKAYHSTGKYQKVRILCQQLAENKNSQVQAWAQQVLTSLPPSSLTPQLNLTPEQAAELLSVGQKALKFRRYAEAISAFEEFFQKTDVETKDYSQAQIWLVKAYKGNGQLEDAIALCQQLTTSEQNVVQIWAKQFISTLLPEHTAPTTPATQSTPTVEEAAPAGIKMRTLAEFKSFCQQNLLSDLKELEATRQQVLNSIVFVGIILLIILVFLIRFFPFSFFNVNSSYLTRPPLFIVFLFLFGFLAWFWSGVAFYTSATETYASGFKSKIIQKIFDFINTDKHLSYSSYSSDADTEYTMSGFIHSQLFQSLIKPNKIHQNECIFGKINQTPIFFSEICAEVEIKHAWAKYLDFMHHFQTLDSGIIPKFITRRIFSLMLPIYIITMLIKFIKGGPYVITRISRGQKIDYKHFKEEILNNEVSRKTIFKGLFFQADYNKTSKGKTIIIPKILDANIHAVNKGQIIKLEDPEFAKLFTVYGDDQVEARYILSTNLMAKLVKFRKKAQRKMYISFVDSMIYIAIEYAEDIFEPKLFNTMLSFNPMKEYFENIQLMLGIVEDLNLDRRIWNRN